MVIDSVKDLENGATNHIVITGTVGQGKSVFLKYLCIREIETGNGLPILIELRNATESRSLHNLICEHVSQLGFTGTIDQDFLEALFSKKLVTIFLDGYDEVKHSIAPSIREEIHALANRHPNLRVIVSSRPTAISQQLDRLVGFNYLEISQLANSDFSPFLTKIGVDTETKERVLSAIQNSSTEIRELLKTPLMLTLVITACGTRPSLPDTLPDFYQALFSVMASTHDETKPGFVRDRATQISNSQLEQLFKAFCFASKEEASSSSLTTKEFQNSFKRATAATEIKCKIEDFKSDLIDAVCLMAKDGLNSAFIHKSIQEYFAASFIADLDDDEIVKQVYERIRRARYSTWLQELQFLKDIDSYRHKKYYLIPSANSILTTFNFTPSAKNPLTDADLVKGIEKISPSLSFDHDDEEFVVSINVNTIAELGARQYIFTALQGIIEIIQSELNQDQIHELLHTSHDDEIISPLCKRRTTLGRKIRSQIRRNVSQIHETQKALEESVNIKRENLLSIVLKN